MDFDQNKTAINESIDDEDFYSFYDFESCIGFITESETKLDLPQFQI